MSGGYGPPLLDFSPIGDLAGTFFDARDKARKRKLEDMQLQAPDEIAKIQIGALNGGAASHSTAPDPSTSLSSFGQPQAAKLPTFAGGGSRPMTMPANPELAQAIKDHATAAGINPIDLATAISYETAGTFDPWKAGPTTQWGQHRGLIQWGEPQAKQYGVTPDMPVGDQVAAAVKYLQDRGVKPGMGLMDIYSAINAGSVGRYNASDANNGGAPGTVADKVNNQMSGHREKAQALLTLAGLPQAKALPAEVAGGSASPFPDVVPLQALGTRMSADADTPAPGAQNAQFQIPGQPSAPAVSAPPQFQIPAQIQAALQSKNPYVRKWAVDQVQEYQKAQREMSVKLWERQDQRTHEGQVRQETWGREDRIRSATQGREDQIRADTQAREDRIRIANQGREDKIRQGTWTREDEVRHKTWEREERLKKEERSYQETAPTPDMKEYNFYSAQEIAADREPEDFRSWQRGNKKAGATVVDASQKGDDAFTKTLGETQAKRWNGYIETADGAQAKMADIQQMRELSRRIGSQGSSANGKLLFGPYLEAAGISVDGLSDMQVYDSLVKRLAPNMRAPGSGGTSDVEYKGFVAALGPLSNNPAAREMIIDTFEAASRNDLARGEIATKLATGELDRKRAEIALRQLPDPLTAFREFRGANPDLVGEAIKNGHSAGSRPAAPAAPKPGDVQQGYRFKGGNPADQSAWEKVQ